VFHKYPPFVSVTPCKAQVGASYIFRLLGKKRKKKKGLKVWGQGEEGENMHFFQAFYSLNVFIFFLFFLCCLVAFVVQKSIVDFHFMHPLP
jgi:hypothetical protein